MKCEVCGLRTIPLLPATFCVVAGGADGDHRAGQNFLEYQFRRHNDGVDAAAQRWQPIAYGVFGSDLPDIQSAIPGGSKFNCCFANSSGAGDDERAQLLLPNYRLTDMISEPTP